MSRIRLAALVALSAMSPQLNAQVAERSIRLSVTDPQGNPVPYASVTLGREPTLVADSNGTVHLKMPAQGNATINVRRIGYLPGKIDAQPTDSILTIQLEPAAQVLPAEQIRGEGQLRGLALRGFYRRMNDKARGAGSGWFITPEELEARKYVPRITTLLGDFPSMRIVADRHGNLIPKGSDGCTMTIFLDGQRLGIHPGQRLSDPTGFYTRRSGSREDAQPGDGIDVLIKASTVAGIEVYPRPGQIPPQFQLVNGNCGAVLIWTR
jgi:hypothetical protein